MGRRTACAATSTVARNWARHSCLPTLSTPSGWLSGRGRWREEEPCDLAAPTAAAAASAAGVQEHVPHAHRTELGREVSDVGRLLRLRALQAAASAASAIAAGTPAATASPASATAAMATPARACRRLLATTTVAAAEYLTASATRAASIAPAARHQSSQPDQ